MRSFIIPLAALAASVLAIPVPGKNCVTETKGNKIIEIYDVTVTQTVYRTAGVPEPTTTSVPPPPPPPPTYAPAPEPTTYAPPPPPPETTVYYVPEPSPSPQPPSYEEITYNAPQPEPEPEPETKPVESAPAPDSFAQECVDAHNKLRAKHGAPPVSWDSTLASYAESSTGCDLVHTGGPYGENLAKGYKSATAAIEAWYNEVSQYNFGSPGYVAGTGHFTQVIWKATDKIGCHLRKSCDMDFFVCEYEKPGNVIGADNFSANVKPAY